MSQKITLERWFFSDIFKALKIVAGVVELVDALDSKSILDRFANL